MMQAVKDEKVLHNSFIKGLRYDVVVPIPSKYLGGCVGDKDNAQDLDNVNGSEIEDAKDAKDEEDAEDGSDSVDSEFYDRGW
jgi:hypothetical protein